jgi:hypothetical protein
LAAENARDLKNRMGSIGASLFASHQANAASSTTPAAIGARIPADVQPSAWPRITA